MRVLIIGAGAVGFHLARRLTEESHEVTVVDSDPSRVQRATDNLDVLAIRGNGASIPVLDEAGIADTDILIAVSASDEVNLVACLVASQRGVGVKVARVSHPEYHESTSVLSREVLGVDLLIGPEQSCALEAFELLSTPAATDFARFAEGRVVLMGMRVLPDAPIAGRFVSQLEPFAKEHSFVVAAVVKDGETIVPRGSTRIEAGDKVFFVAPAHAGRSLTTLAGHEPFRLQRVMIGGGSDEAVYLSRHLLEAGAQCTILESDRERCRDLADLVPGALVLHGDTTDLDLLEMEGVEGIDGFVALTNRDEVNMLAALLAKNCGARRAIPLIHKMEYMALVERVGLDAAVSPRISAANAILRYVRKARVSSVATLKGSGAEAMETVVGENAKVAGRPLRDLKLPSGALIGAIVRDDRVIMPRGGDALEPGDHAIVFAVPEARAAIEKMLI